MRRGGLRVERARVDLAALEDAPVVGGLAALPRGAAIIGVDDGSGEVALVVPVVVDRDDEASAAQLHARARGGAAEGHPFFLHVLVEVEGTGPGLAVVVGVDHLQEAGTGREQRLVGIFPISEEHVTAGLFLSILGDGNVAALGDSEGGGVAVSVRDAAVLVPGVGGPLAVVQEVASLLVDAEAGLGVGLTDPAGEVVDEDDEASVTAVLDDARIDDRRALRPVTGVGEHRLEVTPGVSAVEGAAHREVDRVGGVIRDGLTLVGTGDDDPGLQGNQRGDSVADGVVKPGIEEALRVEWSDGGQLFDLRVVEDRGEEGGVADLAEEAGSGGVLTDDDLVEGIDGGEESLSGQVGLKVTVHVDLDRAVSDAHDNVVPVSLIPMAVSRERAPLARAAQDLVFDAVGCHGQVQLLGACSAGCKDRSVLPGAAHAIAGEDGASGEFGQLGDVVIRQVGGGELDEGRGDGGEGKDLFRGEDGLVLREGADLDAGSRGEGELRVGAASGGGEVCGGREALVAVEEDLRTRRGRSESERMPGAIRDGGGVFHVQGEGHRVC